MAQIAAFKDTSIIDLSLLIPLLFKTEELGRKLYLSETVSMG
jgi:hypothetical protein